MIILKEYLQAIIASIVFILTGIIMLSISVVAGPNKSRRFIEGFLRGLGFIKPDGFF